MENLLATDIGAIVNIVALVFVILFTIWGFVKGFTKTFLRVFGSILAMVVAGLLAPAVAKFLQDKFSLINRMSESVSGVATKIFGESLMNSTLEDVATNSLESLGLAGFLKDIVQTAMADSSIPTTTTLGELICPTFGYYIVLIIAFVALYIVFKIIFFLIGQLVKKLYAFRVVAVVDRVLGLALGFISGVITLELIIMVISIIPVPFFQELYTAISLSTIGGFIEKINIYGIILNALSTSDVLGHIKGLIIQ